MRKAAWPDQRLFPLQLLFPRGVEAVFRRGQHGGGDGGLFRLLFLFVGGEVALQRGEGGVGAGDCIGARFGWGGEFEIGPVADETRVGEVGRR